MTALPPRPPNELIHRVGWFLDHEDPYAVFDARGREQWALIRAQLPDDFSFDGARALDFGAGAGRILRHACTEHPEAEFWGSDIDARSVDFLKANFPSNVHPVLSTVEPPLPVGDAQFKLAWAFSVFTHLTVEWSAWLAELHRVIEPGGVLVATCFGPSHSSYGHIRIGEDITGMHIVKPDMPWDGGGPFVILSEWWIHAYWGRGFEILDITPGSPLGDPPLYGQSIVSMRRKPGPPLTVAELEEPASGDPREVAALKHNIETLRQEVVALGALIRTITESKSWQWTGYLRRAGMKARELKSKR